MFSAVFRIFVKKIEPDYINIWNVRTRTHSTGSGLGVIILGKKYIMTNAHVIENNNYIDCVKYNSDKRYTLELIDIAYELDLALLSVADTDFWDGVNISNINKPPQKGSLIRVIGFPQNG